MILKQYYLGCLSHASYLLGDEETGRAIVIDPRRDVAEYLDDAAAHGLRIEGVFNTHFHADFVAGHLELAKATGAWIGYGARAEASYEIRSFADGEQLALGFPASGVVVEVMETPGHTWESASLLVRPNGVDSAPTAVLTGDTLFIGDVGRPDLAAAVGADPLELASAQYDSVRRLMALPGDVVVMPAHGAGSACGKNLSDELESTIADQRISNTSAQDMPREAFIEMLMSGQPAIPAYFGEDALLNRADRGLMDAEGVGAVDVNVVLAGVAAGAVAIDVRSPEEFASGHVSGSLNVGLAGRFAETLGMVAALDAPVLLVVSPPQGAEGAEEARVRAARIGLDGVAGYLILDADALQMLDDAGRLSQAARHDVASADEAVRSGALYLDVRNPGEVESGAVEGSLRIPLAELPRRLSEVPGDVDLVVHCAGGWRSSVAASVLRSAGFERVSDLLGGFGAWSVAHGGDVAPVAVCSSVTSAETSADSATQPAAAGEKQGAAL